MEIRAATLADLENLPDIDGAIDSSQYVHLERSGDGLSRSWNLEERPLRSRLVLSNPMDDETRLLFKQLALGAEEGVAMVAEHESAAVASLAAQAQSATGVLRVVDLRVDFEQRRQGLATVMLYQVIQEARNRGLRAVMAQSRTNNMPAARLLLKVGFELAGLDAQFHSNHDLVKEVVALFWYVVLD